MGMTGGAHERDWQVLQSEDIAFLQQTRGELEAMLENQSRWTELMKNLTGSIPRERDGRSEKFGQDPLGKGLLAGASTREVDAMLVDEGPQRRLRALIEAIDRRIAELTPPEPLPGEPSEQRPKHAA